METLNKGQQVDILFNKFKKVCDEKGYDVVRELDRAIDFLEVDNPVETVASRQTITLLLQPYIANLLANNKQIEDALTVFTYKTIESAKIYRDGMDYERNLRRGSHGAVIMYLWQDLLDIKTDKRELVHYEIPLPYNLYSKIRESARKYDSCVTQCTIFLFNTLSGDVNLRKRIIKEYINA